MIDKEFAGFWIRVGASLIDTVLMLIIVAPVMTLIYGKAYWLGDQAESTNVDLGIWHFLFNYIVPAVAILLFWIYKSATPGKMALKLRIVDVNTGQPASKGQLIGRYFAYYVSAIPLCIGFFWVAFDKRKQGWHDKLSGTAVVKGPVDETAIYEKEI